MADEKIRLQKFLSECGAASRRKAEEMISQGKVTVNGQNASVGDKVDPARDDVRLLGKRLSRPDNKVYLMLNKPRGYITTMNDEQGRKCVAALVKDAPAAVFPVGRLDKDSEGLLLFTNDGEFANDVMHPRRGVKKTYRVTVRPNPTDAQFAMLCDGTEIDGAHCVPVSVRMITRKEDRAVAEIVVSEGRNREVRRLCEAADLEVARLTRTAVGGIQLGTLKVGAWRILKPEEIRKAMEN